MTETMTAAPAAPGPSRSVASRIVGILLTPRATYADVAARPRWAGVFFALLLIMTAAATTFLSTEAGRIAIVDQQIAQAESYGVRLTQVQLDAIEARSHWYAYLAPLFQFGGLALGSLVVAGIAFAVFTALLGGDATFRQVFAAVVHSWAVPAVLTLFTTPLAYARESVAGATNLAVFLPFLDDSSFAARMLGAIDLVYIWWILSLSIGLGVVYRRRTAPIAASLLVIYASIGLIIATIKTVVSGV